MPSIWKRAVRLTKKRYESANPITMSEFRADKDQLRAQFALKTRKLEMQIEKLRKQLSEQLVELNENKSELALMDVEQDKQITITKEQETQLIAYRERIIEFEKQIADLSQKLRMRERELETRNDNSRDRILELEKKTIGLSHKLRMKEREIKQLKSSIKESTKKTAIATNQTLLKTSPKKAEAQIARANSMLDELAHMSELNDAKISNNNRSLAQDLLYEEEVEKLHEKIIKIEKIIIAKWQKDNHLKKSDLTSLRKKLEEIASIVSSLVYAKDSDVDEFQKETLFEKVQKFAQENDSDKKSDNGAKTARTNKISKRLKPVYDHTQH